MKRGISDRESSASGSDIMYPSVDVNPHSQRATDDEDRIRDEVSLGVYTQCGLCGTS